MQARPAGRAGSGAEASGRSLPPGSGKPWGPRAGQGPHEPLFSLRVSPCLRGMVVVADKTSELYRKTYWASYNIPYVPPATPPLSVLRGAPPRWL